MKVMRDSSLSNGRRFTDRESSARYFLVFLRFSRESLLLAALLLEALPSMNLMNEINK